MLRIQVLAAKIGAAVKRSAHACARNRGIRALLGVAAALAQCQLGFAAGDDVHGEMVYRQCLACHALDKNAVGPKHRDVFGRHAGSIADYNYSPALKAATIVWDEATLDAWLSNPQALVPGSKMFFSLGNAQDRADVIAFLKDKARSDASAAASETK